jgi:hypothetical protein
MMMRSGKSPTSVKATIARSSSVVRRPSFFVRRRASVCRRRVVRPSEIRRHAINQSINQSIVPSAFSAFSRADSRGRPVTHEPTNDGTGLKKPHEGVDRHVTKKKTGGKRKNLETFFWFGFEKIFFLPFPPNARRNQTKKPRIW